MQSKVWFLEPSNKYYLRYVFPNIRFTESDPIYAPVVLSPFSYLVSDSTLFFHLTPSGYPLDQLGGFSRLIESLSLFDPDPKKNLHKLSLLKRYNYPDCASMYKEFLCLRLLGSSWAGKNNIVLNRNLESMTDSDRQKERSESFESSFPARVVKAVQLPLGERLAACESIGFSDVGSYLFNTLYKFWSRDLQGRSREFFAPVASAIQRESFLRTYEFSEFSDPNIDAQMLLTYFR